MAKLVSFSLFEDLPTELQLKTWKLAIPKQRIVQIDTAYPNGFGADPFLTASTFEPGLLLACKASRQVMLEVCKVCIDTPDGKVYIDGESDIVLFTNTHMSLRFPDELALYVSLLDQVKTVVLSQYALFPIGRYTQNRQVKTALLNKFRFLDKLIVLSNDGGALGTRDPSSEVWLQTEEETKAPQFMTVRQWVSYLDVGEEQLEELKEEMLKACRPGESRKLPKISWMCLCSDRYRVGR